MIITFFRLPQNRNCRLFLVATIPVLFLASQYSPKASGHCYGFWGLQQYAFVLRLISPIATTLVRGMYYYLITCHKFVCQTQSQHTV